MQEIVSGRYLAKTIFVMPPLGQPSSDYDPAADWTRVRELIVKRGLELPEYSTRGALVYCPAGKPLLITSRLKLGSKWRLRLFVVRASRLRQQQLRARTMI
jgi:hypothetical protein